MKRTLLSDDSVISSTLPSDVWYIIFRFTNDSSLFVLKFINHELHHFVTLFCIANKISFHLLKLITSFDANITFPSSLTQPTQNDLFLKWTNDCKINNGFTLLYPPTDQLITKIDAISWLLYNHQKIYDGQDEPGRFERWKWTNFSNATRKYNTNSFYWESLFCLASKHGRTDVLQFLMSKFVLPESVFPTLYYHAANNGHCAILDCLNFTNNFGNSNNMNQIYRGASECGSIDVLEWCFNRLSIYPYYYILPAETKSNVCYQLAKNNHFETFKWAIAHEFAQSYDLQELCDVFTKHGNVEAVKYINTLIK